MSTRLDRAIEEGVGVIAQVRGQGPSRAFPVLKARTTSVRDDRRRRATTPGSQAGKDIGVAMGHHRTEVSSDAEV